jgi:NADH:ubiquinone oxidoreductase subunit C
MTTASDSFVTTLCELGLGVEWEWRNGSWWKTLEAMDVRATATFMVSLEARFVAITAMERPDKEVRLDYQWDLNGQLLSFTTMTAAQRIATIADICPAADWVERETHEYFAVEFIGRENTKPLMTRAGDPIGINLRKEVAQ